MQRYVDIERTRFADRLTVQFEIDPTVLSARVPCLSLQPLVENAVRHGIAARPTPGSILVRAKRENVGRETRIRETRTKRVTNAFSPLLQRLTVGGRQSGDV